MDMIVAKAPHAKVLRNGKDCSFADVAVVA
jgi:hypothetical protein